MAAEPTWLVRVDVPYACFWFDVSADGRVLRPPPIARWMRGKLARDMVRYWRRRGTVSILLAPERMYNG